MYNSEKTKKMKTYHLEKLKRLHKGEDFFSIRHSGDCYYSLSPICVGIYELYRNDEHQPDIIVRFSKDKIASLGKGTRSGYQSIIALDDLEFLDDNNYSRIDDNSEFIASFMGEEINLVGGDRIEPNSFFVESGLLD